MQEPKQAVAPPNVHNGTYTVSHETRGHFTLKLHTVQDGDLAGKRILSMLVGPDNTANYRGVAFWDDATKCASVWKRFQGTRWIRIDGYHWTHAVGDSDGIGLSPTQKKLAIWADLVIRGASEERSGHWYGNGYRLDLAGHCCICNRKLTDPESIRLGIGPTCGGRS